MSGPSPIQIARTNTALDPVGVCLALEGRLNSSDGREGLAGALRQASEGAASNSSNSVSKQQQAGAAGDGGADPAPRCLSSQAHQLSGDCLSAFAAAADQPADDSVSSPLAGDSGAAFGSGGPSESGLSKQDTLAPASLQAGSASSASSGSSAGGGAGQRPLVTAAIERTSTATLDANGGVDHGAGAHDPSCTCPPYAVKSTCGKRPNMEDTYALCPNICELPMSPMSHEYADKLPHRIAVQFETHRQDLPREQAAAAAAAAGGTHLAAHPQQQQHHHQHPQQAPGQVQQPSTPDQQQTMLQQGAACAQSEPSAAAFAGAAALPGQLAGAPEAESSVSSLSSGSDGGVSLEKLHFFGVYDGHGGIEASQHCAQRLHYHLSKAVAEMASVWLMNNAGEEAQGAWNPEVNYAPLDTARVDETSPGECFLAASTSTDEAAAAAAADALPASTCSVGSTCSSTGAVALSSSNCSSNSSTAAMATTPTDGSGAAAAAGAPRSYGRSVSAGSANAGNDSELDSNEGSSGDSSDTSAASFSGMMEEVLRDAFIKTDEEFSDSGLQAGLVGSTAVVALVGTHRVWIANCGDSRAVLSRGGRAVQVTDDHKPEREDEAERVEKAGGQVLYWNGHRVMGVLAMSRAIGDHCLRPYVIPEPEISVFARHARDELLLLASDGLWDVLSNQEATDLALRSIKRAREKGASRKAAARVAATVLTKAAVDRGSRDNITVVIIDLTPPPRGGDKADKAATAAAAPQADAGSTAGACTQQQVDGQQQPPLQEQQQQLQAEAAAEGSRPGSARSSSSSRQASAKPPSRSGSGGSNPFAAAAVSPFSTAATGSSELPLPPGAAQLEAVAAVAASSRTSAVGSAAASCSSSSRLRSSAAGGSAGSAFAAAASSDMGSAFSNQAGISGLATELDSLDLSGAQAVRGHSRRSSKGSMQHVAEASGSAATAGNSSTASSQLEEQPTIVEPPPELPDLYRQPSSSPFSTCQGPAFGDGMP